MRYFEKQSVFIVPERMVAIRNAATNSLLKAFNKKGPEAFTSTKGKILNFVREGLEPFASPEVMSNTFYTKVKGGMKESFNKFREMMK